MAARNEQAISGDVNFVQKYRQLSSNVKIILSLVAILIVISVTVGIINPRFFMISNLRNILVQCAGYTVLAVGLTLVMTAGGLDISIGAIMGLSTAVMGVTTAWYGIGGVPGVIVGLLIGVLCGAVNGAVVVLFNVPSLIVTLGTRAAFRNLGYIVTQGELIFGMPDAFRWFSRGRLLGVPVPIVIPAIVALWGIYYLYRTKSGRHLTAIGGNREAAILAGIKVKRATWSAFVISGLLCGLGAVIAVARLDAAQPQIGTDYEIHVIASVVLGGTLLTGGRGLMLGSILAVIILQVISNGMVLMNVPYFWQQVVIGVLFVAVVAVRTFRSKEVQKIGL